jgi:ADP-ribose pyrophosphatase YjhB (NUDIX family)
MTELITDRRNAVRAVIVRGGSLLVQLKKYDSGQVRYTLPGGAPDLGETLEAGLQRECREEIGSSVEIVDLMHVADFYKPRDTNPPSRRQQVEFLFLCRVPSNYVPGNGSKPDKHQVDVVWLPLREAAVSNLYPLSLRRILTSDSSQSPIYLGLID